jgi:hypothetical protein
MQVVFPCILLESEAGILKNYCATNAGSVEVWSMVHTYCSNSELGGLTRALLYVPIIFSLPIISVHRGGGRPKVNLR